MDQYSFSTFGYPGATDTDATGINNAGEIVGSYFSNNSGGFVYNGESFVSYSYPGSMISYLTATSDDGSLVGQELTAGHGYQSFVFENGTFQQLPMVGSDGTFASGISASGQEIVGSYLSGQHLNGFSYINGQVSTIMYPQDVPPAFAAFTYVNGVNDAGETVGQFQSQGFLDNAGVFTNIVYPGAASTDPSAINDAGEIAGTFTDAAGSQHGFTDIAGVFCEVDVPGSTYTTVDGVNNAGQLVGSYDTSASTSGAFVATPVVCFCEGSRIRILRNDDEIDVPVESLAVGDLVVTQDGAARSIRWLGHRSIDCTRHARPEEVWPIRIAAGAFGKDRGGLRTPSRDLRVSPGHNICFDVQGEILVPASALVDGRGITRERPKVVTYWHVELDQHDILLAENTPCESYLDVGNRDFFAGEALVRLRTPPDGVLPFSGHAGFCRPIHADGPMVAAVRRRLAMVADAVASPCRSSRDDDAIRSAAAISPSVRTERAG